MPTFESHDGLKLSYEVEGDGPAVVLVHGFVADTFTNWVRPGVVSRLSAGGYRVCAFDQRGHGMSEKPHEASRYGIDAMVGDIKAFLDHLEIERCVCVGYSMGARNTLHLVASGEPRIKVAVLGGVGDATLSRPMGGEAMADAMLTEDKSTIAHPMAKSFRDFADLTRADRESLAAMLRGEGKEFGEIGGVDIPVLVLHGDNDPLIGDPQGLADKLGNARAVEVGGSHLNVVNNPQFHEALVSFIDEHREAIA